MQGVQPSPFEQPAGILTVQHPAPASRRRLLAHRLNGPYTGSHQPLLSTAAEFRRMCIQGVAGWVKMAASHPSSCSRQLVSHVPDTHPSLWPCMRGHNASVSARARRQHPALTSAHGSRPDDSPSWLQEDASMDPK